MNSIYKVMLFYTLLRFSFTKVALKRYSILRGGGGLSLSELVKWYEAGHMDIWTYGHRKSLDFLSNILPGQGIAKLHKMTSLWRHHFPEKRPLQKICFWPKSTPKTSRMTLKNNIPRTQPQPSHQSLLSNTSCRERTAMCYQRMEVDMCVTMAI